MAWTRRSTIIAIGGTVFSVLSYFVTQVSMLVTRPDWSVDSFRAYYAGDQLSYLSMIVNGSNGDFAAHEPFTQSGANNYPHLWYTVLGWFSNVTGISPVAAWTIGGLVLQSLLVLAVSVSCVIVTRRAWTAFAGVLPLVLGTFSWALSGNWQTQMDSHAVLWGAFAVLFTLNGEAAALCIAGIAMLALVTGASATLSRRGWLVLGTSAGLAIGVLANVQTYSFLTGAYLVAFGVATYAIVARPRRLLIILSLALGVAVFAVGPLIAPGLGQLLTLTLGLAPAVPGLIALIIRTRGLLVIPGIAAILAASPQIVGTYLALRDGDPFLNYRVASSKDLGVVWYLGLICAAAVLVVLVLIVVAGIMQRNTLWTSYPIAMAAAWIVLSQNDLWGANQEPYRFWIDCFMLTAVTMVPIALHVAVTMWKPSELVAPRRSTVIRVLAVTAAVVMVASAVDWAWFYRNARATDLWSFSSPKNSALNEAAASIGDGLLLADPCVNPLYLKPATGARVAYYNLGMAWPVDREALQDVIDARAVGDLATPQELVAAGIEFVVTDSACDSDWATDDADRLEKVASADYDGRADDEGTGTVTVWRVDAE